MAYNEVELESGEYGATYRIEASIPGNASVQVTLAIHLDVGTEGPPWPTVDFDAVAEDVKTLVDAISDTTVQVFNKTVDSTTSLL